MSVVGSVVGPDRKGGGLEVKDGCLGLVAVPKGEVERKELSGKDTAYISMNERTESYKR